MWWAQKVQPWDFQFALLLFEGWRQLESKPNLLASTGWVPDLHMKIALKVMAPIYFRGNFCCCNN